MANTYSQIYIQVIFAVEARDSLLHPSWKEELFKYIGGVVKKKGQKLFAIGGVADNIHILIGIAPNISISDLVRDIKANSSKFINDHKYVRGQFRWQEGFGAFSYSRSHLNAVAKYVLNQEAHHLKRSFKDEYLRLLKRFDVEYEEKYLFKWI
ncbi:MAG TPA: IS200/IS605 family transposase [Pyrinomonadaceae bacterium]|nr:IS200/IS605 family transposase [Pyrinomonadaceae bacterium]